MILNTGCRTDIPAYYSRWFYNRVKAGYVCTRNPYRPEQVLQYRLDPDLVDLLCFCTKNPEPMLPRLAELRLFRQFWFVTLTPYGKDIEPHVPDKWAVLRSIQQLSEAVGPKAVGWRYDPVFLTEKYSMAYHLRAFEKIAAALEGRVQSCVISFLDLYPKTLRNFPAARVVTGQEQQELAREFARIGARYGIPLRTCCENPALAQYGLDVSGCMTKEVLEAAAGCRLQVPKGKRSPRAQCSCLLGADIGMYNTCPHGCLYCYANDDPNAVARNWKLHDPDSPFLVGGFCKGDQIVQVQQESYIDQQLTLF